MTAVIFDFGNVINRWEPEAALAGLYGSEAKAQAAMERLAFRDWIGSVLDAGADVAASLAGMRDTAPERHAMLTHYMENIERAHASPVPGTVALIERLMGRGLRVLGMSNAGVVAFEAVAANFPIIARMEDVFISGREGCMKPDPDAFLRLTTRNGLAPADCLFIDDSAKNVAGAQAVGMDALVFTDAATLERDLIERGLL